MNNFAAIYILKILTKSLFLLIFISKQGFCVDIQYFLSPYFFKNPQSYWVNGNQNIKYNLGELFSKAINETNDNFSKCNKNVISDAVINMYPITVYNPVTFQLQTDVKIRVYSLKKKINHELEVSEKNIVKLDTSSDFRLIKHYKNVSTKINQSLVALNLDSDIKMNGEICNTF